MERIYCFVIFSTCVIGSLCEQYFSNALAAHVHSECVENGLFHTSLGDFETCRSTSTLTLQRFLLECKYGPAVREMCGKNPLKPCFTKFEAAMSKCLPKSVKEEFIEYSVTSFDNGLEYLCSNDGEAIKVITDDATKICLEKVKPELDKCNSGYVSIFQKWFLRSFNSDVFCYARGKWGTCLLNALDKCEDKRPKDSTHGLIAAILRSTPCEKILSREFKHLVSSSDILISYSTFLILSTLILSFLQY